MAKSKGTVDDLIKKYGVSTNTKPSSTKDNTKPSSTKNDTRKQSNSASSVDDLINKYRTKKPNKVEQPTKKLTDFNTQTKNAYTSAKNKTATKTTISSNLTEKERKARISEIETEMRQLRTTLNGIGRAGAYGSTDSLQPLKEKTNKRIAELSEELKTLERTGTFTASELKQFEIDDAKKKKASLPSYNPTARITLAEADTFKKNAQDHYKLDKEIETLEREKELYDDITEFGDVVNNDDFGGQWRANYRSNELSREADKAMSEYIRNPTEENKQIAYAYDAFSKEYTKNNEEALDDVNVKASWLTKSAAGYLPQFKDQIIPELIGGGIGGLIGGSVGSSIGAGIATYGQSYDVIRGSVYRTLLAEGVDEETALKAASDEAFISSLIESGETAATWLLTGGTKAMSAIGNAAKSAVAKGSTNAATNLVANMATKATTKATTRAAKKAVAEATRPLWKKALRVGGGIVGNALTEYGEEFTQGAVSRANREQALATVEKEIGQYGRGNIDLYDRPIYKNDDGTISTVDSVTFQIDDKFIVLPTIVWDEKGYAKRLTTDEEILAHYKETGEYLGEFDTLEESNAYANKLHSAQSYYYSDNKTVNSEDNLWIGGAKVVGDALSGNNPEAFDELHEQGKEGFKIGLMFGTGQTAVNSTVSHLLGAKAEETSNISPYLEAIEEKSKNGGTIQVEEAQRASGYGENGSKILAEAVNNATFKTFSEVKGEMHKAYMSGWKNDDISLNTDFEREAYYAGKKDRAMQDLSAKNKAKNATVYDSGVVQNKNFKKLSRSSQELLTTLAKDHKMSVKMEDVVAAIVNGKITAEANAQHSDGKLLGSMTADNAVVEWALHEDGHRMEQMATEEWNELANALYARAERQGRATSQGSRFDTIKAQHDNAGLTLNTRGYFGEVVMREIETIFSSEKEFNAWRAELEGNVQAKNGWQKFVELLSEIIEDIKRTLSRAVMSKEARAEADRNLAELERIKELYGKAYLATRDAVTEISNAQTSENAVGSKNESATNTSSTQNESSLKSPKKASNYKTPDRVKTVLGDGDKSVGVSEGKAYVSNGKVFIPVNSVNEAKTEIGATLSVKVANGVSKLLNQSSFTPINKKPVEGNLKGIGTVRVFTDVNGREIALKKEVAEYFDGYNLEATFRGGKPYAIKATDNDGNIVGVAMAIGMNTSGQKYELTNTNKAKSGIQQGDVFTAKKSGTEYKITYRDDRNTTVEISSAEGTKTMVISNEIADSNFSNMSDDGITKWIDEDLHIDNRSWEDVSDRKVKAFQFLFPEFQEYYMPLANELLGDLHHTIKGERIQTGTYETGTEWSGVKRLTSDAIARIKDATNASYDDIRNALERLINDDGQENIALAKRIELVFDEMLTDGYNTFDGTPIPANEEYIAKKEELLGKTKDAQDNESSNPDEDWDWMFSLKNKNLTINSRIPYVELKNYINVAKGDNTALNKLVSKVRKLEKRTYQNDATGYQADINSDTIRKALHPTHKKFNPFKEAHIRNLNAITKLPELFKNAVYVDSKNPQKTKNQNKAIKEYHHFVAPIFMDNGEYRALITAREKVNSNTLYVLRVEVLPTQKRHTLSAAQQNAGGSQWLSVPSDISIPELVNGVKIKNYDTNNYDTYTSADIQFSLKDSEYLKLAKDPKKNEAKLRAMVEDAAKEAGYIGTYYHGSKSDFTVFKKERGGASNSNAGIGFWFTESEEGAKAWADEAWWGDNEQSKVYKTYLRLNNPKVYETADTKAQRDELYKGYEPIDKEMSLYDSIYYFEDGRRYHSERYDYDKSKRRHSGIYAWDAFKAIVKKYDADTIDYYMSKVDENEREIVKQDAERYLELSKERKALENQLTELRYYDAYENFRTDMYKQIGLGAEDANIGGTGKYVENKDEMIKKYVDMLRQEGYDGISIKNTSYDTRFFGEPNNQYLVFDSNQVKSAEPVTYDNKGEVIPLSERFNIKNDDIRYSLKDSEGKTLTKAQQEFFKDSKIRDKDGNLLVMYHGTTRGGFTVFDGGKDYWYFTNDKKYSYAFEGRKANGQFYPYTKERMEKGEAVPQRYKVYLNVTNPYIADIDTVEDALYWDKSLASLLREKGYDALMVEDMSQVIVLNANQIKNTTNKKPSASDDIRYSLKEGKTSKRFDKLVHTIEDVEKGKKGAKERLYKYVESGVIPTEVYDNYVKQYGAIPTGERPHREVQVPQKTAENKKVSQTVRTILEAQATPDEAVPTIEKMVEDGIFSYESYTDKQAIADSEAYIKEYGWDESLDDWFDAVNKGEVSKELTTMGWALYNNAANIAATTTSESERTTALKTSLKILDAMVRHQRSAAQALQATRILKKLSPETQLYGVQKSVNALQNELQEKYGDKAPDLKIDEQLAEQFINAKTPEERAEIEKEIFKDIGRQMPSRFIDKWNAWRYLAMLGNPRTHIRNILGNAGFAPIVATKNLTATAIESIVYRVSGKKTVRGKALITGSKADRALLQAAWGDYAKVADLIANGGKYNDSAMANQQIEEGRQIFKFKPLEMARKGNSKLLETEDMWFSKPHYAYALAQYCKANNITPEQISRGKAIAPAREYAIKEAQKATYRDTNAFSQMVSEWGRKGNNDNVAKKAVSTVIEGILPFRKTPANILVRGVEYSPLGLIKGLSYDLYQVSKGKMSASEAIDNISAGLTGTGLLALGVYLASQGIIRGHGEDEEEERKFNELMGHQSYSLELPNGQSITLDWLAPEALPFFVGVNMWEATKGSNEETNLSTILGAVSNISEPMLEMSCLQGLNDLFEGIGYASSNDTSGLVSVLSSAVTSYLTQGIPTLTGQAERTGEEERMTTYTEKNGFLTGDMQYTLGKASAKIPFWDYNQIPYIDAWGRREASGTALKRGFNNFLNPAYTSTIESSYMEKELLRLYEQTGETKVFPTRADKYFTVGGGRKDLTAEEYVRYATLKGEKSYKLINDLVQSNAYRKLSDDEKIKAIEEAYDYANQKAKQAISNYKPATWVGKADEFGSNVENYLSFRANVSNTKADNGGKISKQEIVDIVLDTTQNDADIWKMYLTEYDSTGDMYAYEKGIEGKDYMNFLNALNEVDTPTKSGKYGSYTQDEAYNAVNRLKGLSREEKAALWQSVNTNWKKNPFR